MKQLISLKSTYYFFKNLVFTLFCIALGFFLGSGLIKVKAASYINYDLLYQYVNEKGLVYKHGGISVDITEKIDELSEAMNSANMNYTINLKGIPYSEGSNYSMFNVFIYEYNTNNVDINYSATVDGSVIKVDTSSSLSNFITRGISISFPNPFSEASLNTILDNLITYIETNKHLPTTSGNGYSYVGNSSLYIWGFPKMYFNDDGTLNSSSSNMYLIYDTNVSLNIKQTTNFDGFKINDNLYKVNSTLPTYKDIYLSEPSYYTFTDFLETENNSEVRFKFEIPENEMFSFYLNDSLTYTTDDINQGSSLLTAPYLEVKRENKIEVLPLDTICKNMRHEKVYCQTEINSFLDDVESLELVVSLEGIHEIGGTVLLFFESEYPFTYSYTTSYYEEVDFTGNYGILLIPKIYDLELSLSKSIYSSLFLKGTGLNLKVYSDTDLSKEPIYNTNIFSGNSWNLYKKLISSENLNEMIFILNSNFLSPVDTSLLRYDTRYYVHTLCKTSSSCNSIVNPNTGEEIILIPPNISSDDDNLNTIDEIYIMMDEFIAESKKSRDYVHEAFDIFWSNMPSSFQMISVFIYVMLLIFVSVRIGGFGQNG